MNTCIVRGCAGTSQLVKFPRDERKCIQWLEQFNEPKMDSVNLNHVRKYFRLCVDHFEDKYFEKLFVFPKKLLPNAIPTLLTKASVVKAYAEANSDDSNYIDIGSDYRTYFTKEYKFLKQVHSPNLQDVLQKSMKRMHTKNKDCVLQFDYLPIRTEKEDKYPTIGQSQVIVFMLRGLFENWKQLLAYMHIGKSTPIEKLAECICDAIYSAVLLQFNILAVVCAPTSLNIKIMDFISNNKNRKYDYSQEKFEYIPFLNNTNILILYDVPRLLIQLREEFIFMDVVCLVDYKRYQASWEDIETVHEYRKKEKCQVLTDEHVYLPKMNKKSVRHAAQVFSNAVAESLLDYEAKHPKKLECKSGTSKFLSFFNDLFDSLNGYQHKAPSHKPLYKKVRRGTEHYLFWQKCAKSLQFTKFVLWTGEQKKTATLDKWQSTIYGIMELWNTLLALGFNEFVPRRLHMDALDNDLSRIRSHHYYVEDMKWNATVQMKREFYPDRNEFNSGFNHVLHNGANFLTPLYYTFLSPFHSTRNNLDFEKNSDESQFNCLDDNCSTIVAICDFVDSIANNKLLDNFVKSALETNM